jgi:hypothetical protein
VENNTGGYIESVAQAIGAGPDDVVDVNNPETMFQLVRAIANVECGPAALLISDATVRDGIALAG